VDPTERRVREIVARLGVEHGIDYEIVDCDPALADTARFVEAYGYAMEDSANTIVVIGKVEPPVFAACVVLANTRLDVNKVVKQKLGVRKASFASADDTAAMTGMTIGGVTPFGLPDELPLWIDARVMERDCIVLGGGSRACKVVGSPTLLTALPNADVVVDLARPAD
jgi:prolyl-tRNA editing enzyme YbaK/EbsC (Cys-tRNA(Pro) deacylase)